MEETTRKGDLSVSKGVKTGLSRRQKEAIPFLLGAKSVEEGCRNAGLSKATVFRWLRQDLFKSELEKARQELISQALLRLKESVSKAVEGLISLMDSSQEGTRFRAYEKALDFFFKNRELEDLEGRLAKVEKVVLEKRSYR